MNTERMNHLITVLEGVERAKQAFDMSVWIGESNDKTTENYSEACGTACCAMGYAALDPLFNEQGLRLSARCRSYLDENGNELPGFQSREVWTRDVDSIRSFNEALKIAHAAGENAWMQAMPSYQGLDMFEAAQKFFGISQNASFYLFDPAYYVDPDDAQPVAASEVIERVRKVIALNGAAPANAGPVSSNDDYDDEYYEDDSYYSDGDGDDEE